MASLEDKSQLHVDIIQNNDHKTRFYTGLPNWPTFVAVFQYLEPKASRMTLWCGGKTSKQTTTLPSSKPGRKRKLALIDELFAVLMRLRLGLLLEDVADRFGVSPATMSRLFIKWVVFLAKELSTAFSMAVQRISAEACQQGFQLNPKHVVHHPVKTFWCKFRNSTVLSALNSDR